MKYHCIATAAFGLEGIVAKELKHLGLDAKGEPGGARFDANFAEILTANLHMRCADRVLLVLSEQEALSFDAIFEQVYALPWESFMQKDAYIIVNAKCVRSQIMSQRDCQSVGKKAIIKRLQNKHNTIHLPENGAKYVVDIAIHNNTMRISLDTSGEALNKRGYRTWNAEAPIRETLAAAILSMSPWKLRQPLYDPCCGSGTFLIEAAYMALRKPSGLTRSFDMEVWNVLNESEINAIRCAASDAYDTERSLNIAGSDVNAEVLDLAKKHIKQAGLSGKINIQQMDLRDVRRTETEGCFVVNPPYGERLSEKKEAQKLYAALGQLLQRHPGWSMAVISSDHNFERFFGRKSDKKRRVYNARIECNVYLYEAK